MHIYTHVIKYYNKVTCQYVNMIRMYNNLYIDSCDKCHHSTQLISAWYVTT